MHLSVSSGWARISAVALAVSLTLGTVPSVAWSQARQHSLPALGDGAELSLTEERRIGDQIARSIFRDPLYLDDPAIGAYLQTMWEPLVQAALQRGDLSPELLERFAWQIVVGRDRQINAFALPGGYLGVYLGLMSTVSTPDELASVMAHELAHVTQRHISRLITRQNQQAPWVIGAMILGALAANAARNVDIAGAAIVGGQAVAIQNQLNFSRDMEREADRIGFGIMHTAGFNPQGFVTMFDKLQAASRLNDDGAFPYLRSHPLTTERMADMKARTQELASASGTASGAAQVSRGPISLPYHALISARARILAEDQTDRLRAIALTATTARTTGFDELQSFAQLYAATLAAARLRDTRLVPLGLQQLLAHPLATTNAQTQAALAAFEVESWLALPLEAIPAAAHSRMQQYVDNTLAPGGRPTREAMVLSAQVLLKPHMAGSTQQAQGAALVQRLQAHATLHPTDALAWQTLAKLHQAQGQPARAARADAESKLAHLDTAAAHDRLRAAQQLARQGQADHFEASIIDARLRQVQDQLRQEQTEAR